MQSSTLGVARLALPLVALLTLNLACSNDDSADDGTGADASTGTDAAPTVDAASDTGSDASGFLCNMESAAQLRQYDTTNDCFEAPVATTGVCDGTSSEGAGLAGIACAFAPDGQIYVELVCENCILSGAGYVYAQYAFGGDRPASQPGQVATGSQIDQCTALAYGCKRDCSTGALVSPYECVDAGPSIDSGADADAH